MQLLRRLKDNRAVRAALIALLAVLAAVSVYQGARNAAEYSQDLQWDAAKALAMGLDPYELSDNPEKALEYPELAAFYSMFTEKDLKQKMEANQFPSLLVLLYPITVLPPHAAKIAWIVLNMLFTAGIMILLKKTFFEGVGNYAFSAIMLLMLSGTPYRNQIGVGQHTLFSFFFFMLAVYIEKKQPARSKAANSVLMTLCLFVSYFKYTLTGVLAVYFLYRKKYKELAASVAMHVLLTEACALRLGKSFIYMITAPLKVASALESEGGIDLGAMLGSVWPVAAAAVMIVLVYMAFTLQEGKDSILFTVLILWSLVVVYHRTYDMFVLSAAAMVFTGIAVNGHICTNEKLGTVLTVWYWTVIAAVYFMLRVFKENTASMLVTGIIYYAFAIAVSACAIKNCRIRNR